MMAEDKMSDEQKETKPKATLIKHRKEASPSSPGAAEKPEKKKVRVVVRKKAKAPSADEPAREKTEKTEKPEERAVPRAEKAPTPQAEKPEPAPSAEPHDAAQPKKESSLPKKEEPTRPPKTETTSLRDVQKDRDSRPKIPPSVRETGFGQGFRRRPSPDRDRRPGSDGAPPQSRGPVGPGGPPGQRPSGPGGPPGRSGGPSRPYNGPSRGPGAPGGSRPYGGPPRPRPGGGPPPPAGDKKPATGGRKFKTKKKDFQKREKHLEKTIQLKQKKPTQRANPVPKSIDIMEVITVSELARKMNLKASDLIGKLMGMGMMVNINQQIDAETAEILAGEYDCKVNTVSLYDETIIETADDLETDMVVRPPIITVMGHVDHGKTKLLDAIRRTDVVAGEFGGITQHIGAYQVELPQGKLTFLDTPGHEAFTLMRARGADVTDIVILVVAANDGVMPQTKEAIDHAKAAKVPIIVAINKIDLPEANPDRVKQQLSDLGLMPEQWGGETLFCEISALKGDGVPQLLETVYLQADVLELRANKSCNAEGRVIESRIDPGRGTVSTVLVQRGTLRVGDSFIAGVFPGRVRAMFNDRGDRIEESTPSMPVEVLGCSGIPDAGDPFQVTNDEKIARQIGGKRQELKKVEEGRNVKKITLDNLYDSIQQGALQELRVIIKGDVHGSVEALQSSLEKLSTREIGLIAIRAAAGAINENDVMLAAASNAIIIGFHVRPTPRAQLLADREKVEIRKYSVIYDAVLDIQSAMEGMLAPEMKEEIVGTAEVRDTFKSSKIGTIAGAFVDKGKVRRSCGIRVFRNGEEIHTDGKIESLKRFKDDVREVETGYECGISIVGFNDIEVGDVFEFFEIREIAKKLSAPTADEKPSENKPANGKK